MPKRGLLGEETLAQKGGDRQWRDSHGIAVALRTGQPDHVEVLSRILLVEDFEDAHE